MARVSLEKTLHDYFPFGFQVSRKSWDWLEIGSLLDTLLTGRQVSEIYALRELADRFNERQFHSSLAAQPVQAGQLITVGVIVDILRYVALFYCHEEIPGSIPNGLGFTGQRRGEAVIHQPPGAFVDVFPPVAVVQGLQSDHEYLEATSEVSANRETVVSEMMLLSLAMANPAFRPFRALFDDDNLRRQSPYVPLVEGLEEYFGQQPPFRLLGMTLFECLRAPMRASPDSLEGQLDYIRLNWASFLPAELLRRVLLARDILKEERQLRGLGPGPSQILQFIQEAYGGAGYPELARFSQDADWMSNVVIIAKSVYVWLDQLSKKHQRHIKHLDQVPDEELDRLARWGFTGLWLIGLWERSTASQTIKQIMGNPEAAPSAYSIYDYVIASDLGGEAAYQKLRERAWQHGIRLASDMVPNHMGIYSRWVIEHPDWFIQSPYPPFPCYQFTGVDLSHDPRVCLQIDDGYWQHRDAAVVLKRIDKWTGDVRYIYHGNDGTSMPWNDTAQLNFLLPQVREAVIQLILHVARKFPIIRFDAAMTLAKRHYHRLWFPQYGDGGAIPSRAEHGLSKADFDAAFPVEFWREVVDRVAAEQPDTLLLAEAFWLMEGYFVRTLGMHRVYNSAFMNMLKMEDNCKYRMTVKNVLEFSPEVIKRFVNFMNNPDEATAVAQFGKGDKYFGVAMMMVTMPGLPMFGHGQIEGFTEKYGMEYRKAYWDEVVDEEMVHRHETQIFPLMQRRRLFSGAENFAFYDFNTPEGWTDENVFAYSNRADDERAVILYNNAYNTTQGWIHTSTAINTGTDDKQLLVRKALAEALAIDAGDGSYWAFREQQSGLWYIRSARQLAEEGLFVVLRAYQYQAFLDFRQIRDTDGSWAELARRLGGNGVVNLEETYREMILEPILAPFRAVLNAERLRGLIAGETSARLAFDVDISHCLSAVKSFCGSEESIDGILQDIRRELAVVAPAAGLQKTSLSDTIKADLLAQLKQAEAASLLPVALCWIIVHHLGRLSLPSQTVEPRLLTRNRLEDWLLKKRLAQALRELGCDGTVAYFDALLVTILAAHEGPLAPSTGEPAADAMERLLSDPLVREYLQINRFENLLWLNREHLERMLLAWQLIAAIEHLVQGDLVDNMAVRIMQTARQITLSAARAGYQVEKMVQLLMVTPSADTPDTSHTD